MNVLQLLPRELSLIMYTDGQRALIISIVSLTTLVGTRFLKQKYKFMYDT